MYGKGMKGQFFLIGAFIIIILLYTGITAYISPEGFSGGAPHEITFLLGNLLNEYPRALNYGENQSSGIESLVNFTLFARNVTKERNMDLYSLWIVTENVSDDLNVTVGNFQGDTLDVVIRVDSEENRLTVQNGGLNWTTFTGPSEVFSLNVSFNNEEKNLILGKRKLNLYYTVGLESEDDLMVGERFV